MYQLEQEVREYYNRTLKYKSSVDLLGVIPVMERFDLNYLNKYVLDVGCGDGRVSVELARKYGCQVLGLDYAEKRVAKAVVRSKKLKCFFMVKNIHDFLKVFQPKKFDLICCFEVLEHLEEPRKVLDKLRHLVAEGGHIIGSVPITGRSKRHLTALRSEAEIERILGLKVFFSSGRHQFFKEAR